MGEAVAVVANDVLPVAALPDTAFALTAARWCVAMLRHGAREVRLQQSPACCEIIVARWETPDAMQMVWQDDSGDSFEWRAVFDVKPRRTQLGDVAGEDRCGGPPGSR